MWGVYANFKNNAKDLYFFLNFSLKRTFSQSYASFRKHDSNLKTAMRSKVCSLLSTPPLPSPSPLMLSEFDGSLQSLDPCFFFISNPSLNSNQVIGTSLQPKDCWVRQNDSPEITKGH